MIPNRAPSSIWCLSRTNLNTFVRTEDDDLIVVADERGPMPGWLILSRSEARTLAKRINQCLDETRR